MTKEQIKAKFKIGDVIRNKSPYWGEPAHKIIDEEKYGFLAVHTGSKHGPAWNDNYCTTLLSWTDFDAEETMDGPFEHCPWWMQLWLWLLGNTYGRAVSE